jgi:predicted ABC-type ATPase
MSHPSKVDVLVRARAAGFFVQLFFVGNDGPQLSVERIALRVAQGGHDVPREKVIARWSRSMELLPSAIQGTDQASVFDNSAAGIVDVGRLIFHWRLEAGLPKIQQFPPVPNWVRHYVFEPLGVP